jgi:DNA-binding MarR family transcriptional regulator
MRVTDALSLAALNDGDALSFARLQNMLDLTPGNLITHLRKLEDARYVKSEKTWDGNGLTTTVALTKRGRAALDAYTEALRNLLGGLAP